MGKTNERNLVKERAEPQAGDRLTRAKIAETLELFSHWGEALKADSSIRSLLERVDRKVAASGQAMLDFGIVASCRHCEEEEGGSCCGAGIEQKYTPLILLINLLLGETLPEARLQADSCFFLSERGCSLKLRHVLCVNYLCLGIQRMLGVDDLRRLQQITGEEMEAGFIVHEAVKRFIGSKVRQRA